MKFIIRLVLFVAVAALPTKLFAASTLDEWLTPTELGQALGLPSPSPVSPLRTPLTAEEVRAQYGVDVFAEFPVVLVVNKAITATTGQTLTVYNNGQAIATYPTSTGRERWETAPSGKRYFTNTPSGWFRPQRFVRDHYSTTWEADMEFSIFYNGGIAIHATTPDHYADLGKKASGGCVRLTRENAEAVWNLTAELPQKIVPVFTVDGRLRTDSNGSVIRRLGSGVLILVVNDAARTIESVQ